MACSRCCFSMLRCEWSLNHTFVCILFVWAFSGNIFSSSCSYCEEIPPVLSFSFDLQQGRWYSLMWFPQQGRRSKNYLSLISEWNGVIYLKPNSSLTKQLPLQWGSPCLQGFNVSFVWREHKRHLYLPFVWLSQQLPSSFLSDAPSCVWVFGILTYNVGLHSTWRSPSACEKQRGKDKLLWGLVMQLCTCRSQR